jgi:ornithine decarboxylase
MVFKELLPHVEVYYAIKANNAPEIITAIDDIVDGYDIASLGEAGQLLTLGVHPDRILYSNPVKIPRHIKGAAEAGIANFAFDSSTEIEKIAAAAPGSTVYLRMSVSDYGSMFPLSKKFGIDQSSVIDYCREARDAGLDVKGITFHVGSQSENLQVWETAIKAAGETVIALQEDGFDIEFVDLGGGFPADYGDPTPGIAEVARVIEQSVKQYIPDDIRLMAEPGRYIVANSTYLVTTVIGREHRVGTDWLYLDVGTFQGLMEPLEMPNMKYPIRTERKSNGPMQGFTITGPTCDACDTLGPDYQLPSDIHVGDKVYIDATGAYARVYASTFNGFDIPSVRFVHTDRKVA